MPRPESSAGQGVGYYYVCLAIVSVGLAFNVLLSGSPLGASMRGLRDQPRRMKTLGYNVWAIRYIAYVASALLAGVAGILYVILFRFISPHALSLTMSAEVVLMVIAGGVGTVMGPMAGAGVVVLLKNVASTYIDRWPTLLGAIFLFIIVVVPEGLLPGTRRLMRTLIPRRSRSHGESVARGDCESPMKGARP